MRRLVLLVVLALSSMAPMAPMAIAQSAQPQRERIEQPYGRSGFWTSPHPAKTPYRWRMMAIGGGLLAITGFVMLRLVKKASRERAARKQ
jgi:hypothetical protein